MSIMRNPLVVLLEESIRLKESAQTILSGTSRESSLSRLERLVLISITEEGRPRTASQIARNLGHSRQVVLRAANKLMDMELLVKQPNPDHKTSPLLEPTTKGLELEKKAGLNIDSIVKQLLSDDDLKLCLQLSEHIKRLRSLIETYSPER